ncbi:MAG: GspE/PulE family protein [Bacteroidota bacterium]
MAIGVKRRLGELLIEAGYINTSQLDEALEQQKATGERIGATLVKLGYLDAQSLIEVLEFQLGIPHINLTKRKIDPAIACLVPEQVAKKYRCFAVERQGKKLLLAMLDPTDVFALDDLKLTLGYEIVPAITTEDDFRQVMETYYGMAGSMEDAVKDLEIEIEEEAKAEEVDELALVQEAPIVKFVNVVITQGVRLKASDIHIEPTEVGVVIRYRVDGKLRQELTSPRNTQAAIIARIKIMSNMNIAEKRVPQDGRIQMRVEGYSVDLRVSSLPTIFGEKIVMRILFKGSGTTKLDALGFLPDSLSTFRSMYMRPHGIILVTGPTGSGKSTTLSSVLGELNSREVNICTVEDPVEYQINGINQVLVNTKTGLTFAAALRAFLRQDPDIIMVGEIRDGETARIATQAALTGHLVLSTLHTNDAPSSITRLIDMGIEPFLVSSTVIGILAQRLVRGICRNCRESYEVTPGEKLHGMIVRAHQGELPADQPITLYRGRGCGQCNNRGYSGRTAIHELLMMNLEIQALTNKQVSAEVIREAAIKNGMRTLLVDGLIKAVKGMTTVDEVMRAAYVGEG